MRKMKKVLSVLATVVMVAAALTACGGNGKSGSATDKKDTNGDGKVKVGIVSMIENGAFMDMKEGIVAELKAQGYEDSQIDYKCAAGDASALSTIVTNMTDGTYDMIFSIATPPTQALVNSETDTPVFFCAVSAPTAVGILTDMDKPDKNATGTSNAIPVSKIIDLAQATTPVKKIGLIYSGNEDNATNTVKQCEEYLKSINVEYVEKTAASSNDVETATNALIAEGAEAIFVPNDSIIQDGVSKLTEICNEKKIPTYCSSATTVASGCFATLAIDDKGIGKKTVDIAMDYVNGKEVADIPAQVVGIDYCSVNKSAMKTLGISEDNIKTDYKLNVIEN